MTKLEVAFWQRVLELTRNSQTQNTYDYYVASAKLLTIKNNQATILLPHEIQRKYWETNLESDILTAGFEILDTEIKAVYVFPEDLEDQNLLSSTDAAEDSTDLDDSQYLSPIASNLNSSYTFDNFIQGEGNRFAKSASLAVAAKPGTNYNPLFIWGGPGLGKTHLLNAIGNTVQEANPFERILYITTESFVNEFVNSAMLGKKSMDEFREKFRHLDVLMVDDIQFLVNKESTLDEFFNIFNTMFDKKKQIILTSDRSPKNLKNLPDRLVTRFEWGLSVDITPPDFETRVAILKDKIQHLNFKFQKDAIEYLANQIDSNVRDLEGSLKNINLIASLENLDTITVDIVAKAIRSRTTGAPKMTVIPIEKIQEEVGNFYGVTVKEIKSTKRPQNLATARQVAIYLSREMTDNSTTKIGRAFGGRDHSTVLHAYNKIKNLINQDESLKIEINTIKNKLK
ncbi:chromosomal replication initiator protein DnaA [Streptococcus cuniculipharyngis]|uniref:Chromosomal replication initiator protein DnaA n=1 Tax=Streptococcus cuniculipharyngis TaxID=1562651 RepID=A0A5C5SAW3_9STRE|nr:chromosomal replication initiator protein DnaA [Streptococcus cuniculipharyngis]TWS97707.1 chromosomal replication initiator protein DnaA [Streptococcus cuniculipharyngis]